MDEPDWQSRVSPIEEIFFATSPSAKTLRPDERQPFKKRWPGRYIAYDIESFFVGGRWSRSDIKYTSVYLPKAAYEALRQVAFDERCKIHDLLMESVGLALKKRGYPTSRHAGKVAAQGALSSAGPMGS